MPTPAVSDARYVAHFDMLGMQHAVMRDANEAWGALCDLRAAKDSIDGILIEVSSKRQLVKDRLRTFIFSDTIVLFTLADKDEDLMSILTLSAELFARSLRRCVPLRGGIAHGDFFFNFDLELFLGVPLVQAYRIGEEAQWLGVVVDPYVWERSKALPALSAGDGSPGIVEWNIPLRDGSYRHAPVLNWPRVFQRNFSKKRYSSHEFYGPFERLFGPYAELEEPVKSKYENTVDFINAQLEGEVIAPQILPVSPFGRD